MQSDLDFGELSEFKDLKFKLSNFHNSLNNVSKFINNMCSQENYSKMSPEEKVQYDLFLSFSINSLYWTYLRTQGIEPTSHGIANEIKRVRDYMTRSTQLYERKHVMPHIDKEAAQRFIRSGLWQPSDSKEANKSETVSVNPLKRKRGEDS